MSEKVMTIQEAEQALRDAVREALRSRREANAGYVARGYGPRVTYDPMQDRRVREAQQQLDKIRGGGR